MSALCADVVSPWGNNRADDIRPYELKNIDRLKIRTMYDVVHLCRGGYQPPANVANF